MHGATSGRCPFCEPDPGRVFHRGESALALWDAFPVSRGHALIVPVRHVASWFDLTACEHLEILEILKLARQRIEGETRPDGFNIGINDGRAAGQTIFHVHVHLIPRYHGDVSKPTGGVRHVIPGRGNYLAASGSDAVADASPLPQAHLGIERALAENREQIFLPLLLRATDRFADIDLAVAFILPSGLGKVYAHLQERLERGGRIRIVTGDYLDLTDPVALRRLMDLGDRLTLKVFETKTTSFHPKVYIFRSRDGSGSAYVGSSNLTASALESGVEWNYKVERRLDPAGFAEIERAFEALLTAPETRLVTDDWIEAYEKRRRPPAKVPVTEVVPEEPEAPPEPHQVQREALAALDATRAEGNTAGLVVIATGLGKTWLAAFDSNRPEYRRILFVAHREEILAQAMATFRRIRPKARLGKYTGQEKVHGADILFASIQTLSRIRHLRMFEPDAFDYIIVDEFHHAAAATYRKLIRYFTPKFLLGLTATPDRTDGGDLLGLCGQNLVYRCDFVRGIELGWLSPFRYLGVPDEVNYTNIPWRGTRFDEELLAQAVATQRRAQNALEQYRKHGGRRMLGFCCSRRHADFMAEFFCGQGVRAVPVHAGPTSAPRADSLERLQSGELEAVFSVDMFNEGVDLPNVDTVMMLRPTESSVLWTQQFGRGLRTAEGKTHLRVIDYIGNHRVFLLKLRTMLEPLLERLPSDADLSHALELVRERRIELPEGCDVTYELEAVNIMLSMLRKPDGVDGMRVFYEDFRDLHGIRPTAAEVYQAGHSLRAVRKHHGSWFRFVHAMGDAPQPMQELLRMEAASFLEMLESTPMTRSFKMVVLLAMLDRGRFPGSIGISELVQAVRRIISRRAPLRDDLGVAVESDKALEASIIRNPIAAWSGGGGTGGRKYFEYSDGVFTGTVPGIAPADSPSPDEDRDPDPGEEATAPAEVGSQDDAVRRAFREAVQELVDWRLAEYLDRPGVVYGDDDATKPVAAGTLDLWREYLREEIPGLFGQEFNTGLWNLGFVVIGKDVFLLVTLKKEHLDEAHRYDDQFISPTEFQWQSQNKTTQASKHGRIIQRHRELGYTHHLWVRRTKTHNGKATPFRYCGPLDFIRWEGEKPITVWWRLENAVPDRYWDVFGVREQG